MHTHRFRAKVAFLGVLAFGAILASPNPVSGATAPVITSFSPTLGPVGSDVTIFGSNFTGLKSVTLKDSPVQILSSTATQILVRLNQWNETGKFKVRVGWNTATSAGTFTVTPSPTITSFSPTAGPPSSHVTVYGTGLSAVTAVTLNDAPVNIVSKTATDIVILLNSWNTTGKFKVTAGWKTAESSGVFSVVLSVVPGLIAGTVGLWHLDGNALDSSGNGNHGTPNGATVTSGVAGQAYAFDGNDNVTLPNLDFSGGSYTVNIWYRTTNPAITADWRVMIAKTDISSGDQTFEIILGDGRLCCGENAPSYLVWDGGTTVVNLLSTVGPNGRDGNWRMVTATYTAGDQRLYADGCVVSNYTYPGPLPLNSSPVTIGGIEGFSPFHHPWIGDLDEASIYDRVLSASEVLSLWHLHGAPKSC